MYLLERNSIMPERVYIKGNSIMPKRAYIPTSDGLERSRGYLIDINRLEGLLQQAGVQPNEVVQPGME